MTDNQGFIDKTGILGPRNRAARPSSPSSGDVPPDDDTGEELDTQAGTENQNDANDASGEHGSPDADAAEFEDDGSDDDLGGEDESGGGANGLEDQLAAAKKRADVAENESRQFQKRFDRNQSLLDQTIATVGKLESAQNNGQAQPPSSPLDDLEDEEFVSGQQLKKVRAAEKTAEAELSIKKQIEAAQNRQQLVRRQEDSVLNAKDNLQDVLDFYDKEGLANDPEQPVLSALGNYYRAENAMLKRKIESLEKGAQGAKPKEPKSKRNNANKSNVPPIESGAASRDTGRGKDTPMMDVIIARRKRQGR